jgi:hypothetical protein
MLASVVSVQVARRLTQPLGQVREAALQIASGDYGMRCRVDTPREITRAGWLPQHAGARSWRPPSRSAAADAGVAAPARAERTLLDRLAMGPHRSRTLAISVLPGPDASGFLVEGHIAVAWRGRPEPDPLTAVRSPGTSPSWSAACCR